MGAAASSVDRPIDIANHKCHIRHFADSRVIKQILTNLLSNAVKFTPNNGHVGGDAAALVLEPDSELYVAGFGLGSVRRLSMTYIMASLAKPSAMMAMAS